MKNVVYKLRLFTMQTTMDKLSQQRNDGKGEKFPESSCHCTGISAGSTAEYEPLYGLFQTNGDCLRETATASRQPEAEHDGNGCRAAAGTCGRRHVCKV
jgi:hypothetical protein